jgi:ABC-type multidrug transport system fused ATPase/permease subunit
MLSTFRQLIGLLTPRSRRHFYLLLAMIAVMGLAEMVSVAAILPFLAVVSNPGMLEGDGRIAQIYASLGFADRGQFLVLLGVAVFALVVFGLLFSTLTQYAIYRFAARQGHSISSRLLRGYLAKPYTWFLDHHSANLGASVLSEVQQVITQALVPAMKLLSQAVVALFLIALLVVARPLVALVAGTVIVGCYLLIYAAVRSRLIRLGHDKHEANRERFRVAVEAMGGIKEVKLMGLEEAYLHRFEAAARRLEKAMASHNIIAEIPRNILKAVALGGILFFVIFLLLTTGGDLSELLPILGLYAFASLRLFPALQVVYSSVAKLRFAQPVLDKLHGEMQRNPAPRPAPRRGPGAAAAPPLGLAETLELADVHYAYPGAERPAVTGLDLTIPARSTVGLVGGTGAGKTTTVDLILGLLEPQSGEIRVDGVPVTAGNRRAWQNSIGYVPQQIFLIDDTVTANIAFGLPPEAVDRAAVERAARIAELHAFVTTELPHGYDTLVGERGVRLSGGQRQRIGIARALYHDPDVLILDEATSALDNLTERAVMDAVKNLAHAKTIVMIAHRLTTVRNCDIIFMLERGQIIASGRYEELMQTSGKFRSLAGA